VNFQQFGSQLIVEQPSEGLTYFGVCTGDRLELDAYSGETHVGAQVGTVSADGRRIETTWVLYRPEAAAGYGTFSAAGRSTR
jgi:hypothetical protein